MRCCGLPNFPSARPFGCLFRGPASLKQRLQDRPTPKSQRLATCSWRNNRVSAVIRRPHKRPLWGGNTTDACLARLLSSFCTVSFCSVCLSHSGMKIHECVQGHVYRLRMHHDGSRLCVISSSSYCPPPHECKNKHIQSHPCVCRRFGRSQLDCECVCGLSMYVCVLHGR